MPVSHRELRRAYLAYQRELFPDLPENVNVVFVPADCYGEVWLDEENVWTIRIDPKYAIDSRIWRLTLLHEMVHIEVYPYKGHGKKFQQGMLRLAQVGAFKNLW